MERLTTDPTLQDILVPEHFVATGFDSNVYKRGQKVYKEYKKNKPDYRERLKRYYELTNLVAQHTLANPIELKLSKFHTTPLTVLPIQDVQETHDSFLIFVSEYIPDPSLQSVLEACVDGKLRNRIGSIFNSYRREVFQSAILFLNNEVTDYSVKRSLKQLDNYFNNKYGFNGIKLEPCNIKIVSDGSTHSLVVTDICASIRELRKI